MIECALGTPLDFVLTLNRRVWALGIPFENVKRTFECVNDVFVCAVALISRETRAEARD